MDEIEDNSIHLICTSPPYYGTPIWISFMESQGLKRDNPVDEFQAFQDYFEPVWKECFRVLIPGGKAVINVMDIDGKADLYGRWMNSTKVVERCQHIGFVVREDIIWQKYLQHKSPCGSYPMPFGVMWTNLYEHNFVFQKRGHRSYDNMDPRTKEQSKLGKREWEWLRENWWKINSASATAEQHVAPFPLELPFRFIRLLSYVGDTVLDPFLGSGTTMLAARQLRRNCVGYELLDNYQDVILNKVLAKQQMFGIGEKDHFYLKNKNSIEEWEI